MKRGPDHSPKTAEYNPSPVEVALGIPEIVANILHHYPRYGLRGQNNLVTVSTVWHKAMKEYHLQDEPTFEKLIADCLKYPEGVIHILRDDTLLPYLSNEQLLKLISCHGEFAIHLLENDFKLMNQENLLILTKHHPQVAMHLFTTPKWLEKIKNSIYEFGCQHPEIAQYILDNNLRTDFDGLIRRQGLNKLAESSLIIASQLLNDPATFRDLTEPDFRGPKFLYKHLELLIERIKSNEPFASFQPEINTPEDFINHFETLCQLGLSVKEVRVLGDYHPEIALKVLQNETFFEKFLGANKQLMVISWVTRHASVAIYVLNNISNDQLSDLCKIHPHVAKHVTNSPDLFKRLSIKNVSSGALMLHNDELAIAILKSNDFAGQLNSDALMRLASGNPSAAKMILTTKKFWSKLSEADVRDICVKYPHMVRIILNTQSWRELLAPAHFLRIMINPFLHGASKQAKCWDLQTNKPGEEMDVDVVARPRL